MDISLTELFSWNFWTLEKSEVAKNFVLLITAIIGLFFLYGGQVDQILLLKPLLDKLKCLAEGAAIASKLLWH